MSERRIVWSVMVGVVCVCFLFTVVAGDKKSKKQRNKLPEGFGLAAKYPGDKGVAKDPNVVFVEDFEEETLDELFKRWEDIKGRKRMSFSDERPEGSAGKHSLLMRHIGGESTGCHLYRRLLPGYDKLFIRFYVKFAPNCFPIHHFFHVGGYNPATRWPQGGAGERPRGDERFSVGVEPHGKAWTWDYYTYWMEMRGSPPAGKTWGNSFIRDPDLKVKRGKWICVEVMLKLNQPPSKRNGELALWLNGKLVSHLGEGFPNGVWVYDKFVPKKVWKKVPFVRYAAGRGARGIRWDYKEGKGKVYRVGDEGEAFEGFRWRKDGRLKINFLWLLLYITKAPRDYESLVWFDQIIVAKRYIGPIKPSKKR